MSKSTSTNEQLLEVRKMSKAFYDRFGANVAVDNVSFNVAMGEVLGLIGQSGSGKTTVANALVRLLTDVNGVVTFEGKVVSGRISYKRRRYFQQNVQKIFQDPHTALNEKRNVFSTIVEPLKANHVGIKWAREYLRDDGLILQTFRLSLKEHYLKFEQAYYTKALARAQQASEQVRTSLASFVPAGFATANEQALENGLNELFSLFFDPEIDAAEIDLAALNVGYNDLLDYFTTAQKRVQSRDLPWDEVELVEAKTALTNYLHSFDDKKIGSRARKLTRAYHQEIREWKRESHNIFRAIYQQRRTKAKFERELSSVAPTPEEYARRKIEIKRLKEEATGWKTLSRAKLAVDKETIFTLETVLAAVPSDKLTSHFADALATFTSASAARLQARQAAFEVAHAGITARKGEAFKPDPFEVEKLQARVAAAQQVFDRESVEAQSRFSMFEFKALEAINAARDKAHWRAVKTMRRENHRQFRKHTKALFELSQDRADKTTKRRQLSNKKAKLKATFYEQKLFLRKIKRVRVIYGLVKLPRLVKGYFVRELLLDRAVMNALTQVGLKPEHAYRYPHEFSGGQKQRINIARALILQPKLIIADEPIASLDVSIQAQIINLLVDLVRQRNIAMIFIGHDLSIIEYIADSLCVMHLGRIVERGYAAPIFAHPAHPYTKSLLDAIPKLSNANEPFRAVADDRSYLQEYATDKPREHIVEPFHLVLANEAQLARWWGKKPIIKAGADEVRFVGRAKGSPMGSVPIGNASQETIVSSKIGSAFPQPQGPEKRPAPATKKPAASKRRPLLKWRARQQSSDDQTLSKQIAVAKKRAHRSPRSKTVATPMRTPTKSARPTAKKLSALIKKAKRGSK